MNNSDMTDQEMLDFLRQLSLKDFLDVGLHQVAYIKQVDSDSDNSSSIFSVHAADGSQISVMDSYDTALAAIRVNDLHPVTVH